jgi:hypothetical protein
MTYSLSALPCPGCGGMIAEVHSNEPWFDASSFETCARRCEVCGIGVSNALDAQRVTYIHRDPLTNIPEECRQGALDTLASALNARSRSKKKDRFGFSTSEDAVTWVVFSYLMRSQQLVPTLQKVGLVPPDLKDIEPVLLLWGARLGPTEGGSTVRDRLVAICTALGEDANSFSEPDVIVDLGEKGVVFIEVKYLSGNDRQPASYRGWPKYRSEGRLSWRFAEVQESGCYELARNWCLLERLAEGRPGVLANLGPPSLFLGAEGVRLDRFVDLLGRAVGSSLRG